VMILDKKPSLLTDNGLKTLHCKSVLVVTDYSIKA
jgi:hypothetical protein